MPAPRNDMPSQIEHIDDAALSDYQVVRDYLEHPVGTMRHAGVRFQERWAEDF